MHSRIANKKTAALSVTTVAGLLTYSYFKKPIPEKNSLKQEPTLSPANFYPPPLQRSAMTAKRGR